MSRYERANKKRKVEFDEDPGKTAWKPSASFTPIEGGRSWTLSVAVAASVLKDTFTADQQISIPGRIGRALAVFNVDEVVVYDDTPAEERPRRVDPASYTADTDPCHFLSHVLSYLETPPFMRKALFPLHQNLRLAGKLPSLDMPHHPHPKEWIPYREGVTISRPRGKTGTLVDVGLGEPVTIEDEIPPNTRVTVHFATETTTTPEAVHPAAPRTEGGYYWGFTVRRCSGLSSVFTESPYEDGYDVSIGTSERGQPVPRAFPPGKIPDFKHLLVVFGGPKGIEYAAGNDAELGKMLEQGTKTRELFDYWINVLPGQGSRTIRTDEALFIGLTALGRLFEA
ncbi:hypothetical protein jhhlp_004132 [Lomentospora prolificans]|uniref:Deoxyribose-phosphate aldolase n=1 Tax=Lomentospora prolificans TaxID=41688 RepID=A0A2N3NAN6_9PEZI|nr:hypothetical protein jhhlp_004132 [Lomentospora prolificans]